MNLEKMSAKLALMKSPKDATSTYCPQYILNKGKASKNGVKRKSTRKRYLNATVNCTLENSRHSSLSTIGD